MGATLVHDAAAAQAGGIGPRRWSGEADVRRADQAFGDASRDGALVEGGCRGRQLRAQNDGGLHHQRRNGTMAGGAIGMGAEIALCLGVIGGVDCIDRNWRARLMVVPVLMVAKVIGMDVRLVPADAGSSRPRPLDGQKQQQKDQHDSLHGAGV